VARDPFRSSPALSLDEGVLQAAPPRLAVLAQTAIHFAGPIAQDAVAGMLVALLLPRLADYALVHLRDAAGGIHQAAARHVDPAEQPVLDDLGSRFRPDPGNPYSIVANVLRNDEPLLVPDASETPVQAAIADPAVRRISETLGPTSYVVVPIRSGGQPVGTLTAANSVSRRHYDESDLTVIQAIAGLAGGAIDRAQDAARAERERQQAAARLRLVLQHSGVIAAEQDRDLRFTWIADSDPDHDPARVLGRRDDELAPADTAAMLTALKRQVLTTGQPVRQVVQTTVGGRARVYDVTVEPRRDSRGEIDGLNSAMVDVTERRRVEEELRRQVILLDQAYDAIIAWEWDGPITFWNRGAERLYGYTKAEAVGRVSHALLRSQHPASRQQFLDELERDGFWEGEITHICQDGRRLTVETRHQLLRGPGGGVIVEANRDMTDRQRAEAERQAFLDAAAHDVKNPLTAIIGRAQLLERRLARGESDPEGMRAGLESIAASASHASQILDELVDAARLRLGQSLELHLAPVDLVALAEEAAAAHRGTSPGHTIQVEPAPALLGRWDAARLGRVLDNLLGNAIKYSPAGGTVTIALSREVEVDQVWAVLAVRDEGVGIPAADLPHIFERFHRGGNVAGSVAGSGLGLPAVRQIVAQHGGTIAVASSEGAGTVVTIRLPVPAAE
jgi:PAS domain S-box-containing protein